MVADSGQGSVMQGEGRRATAETGGINRPLVNELHCTYTFPLRGAVIATTRKKEKHSHNAWMSTFHSMHLQLQYIHSSPMKKESMVLRPFIGLG
jgi:hypothetical protein